MRGYIKNKKSLSFFLVFLFFISIFISVQGNEASFCTVRGYVYIDDNIKKPDIIKLVFPSQTINGNTYSDGYFVFDFNGVAAETGQFFASIDNIELKAEETITIKEEVYTYKLNLSFYMPANNPPNRPDNPIPENNSENVLVLSDKKVSIGVSVSDPDNDLLNVFFYNASDHSLIDNTLDVASGDFTSISWPDLNYNKTYSWYAIVNDTEYKNRSEIFYFKTMKQDNKNPNIEIIRPKNNILYIFDKEICSFRFLKKPLIFGDITIKINATDNETGIKSVNLSIEKYRVVKEHTFTQGPYEYSWDSFAFGKYKIVVVAEDLAGNKAEDMIQVRKYL